MLRARGDRGSAVNTMQRGAQVLVPALFAAGRFDGVLGLGGGGGTAMITAAMHALPVGVPKLMVSTMASGNTAPYDVDVADMLSRRHRGPDPLSRRILGNAAGAIAGMVAKTGRPTKPPRAPLLAATMFGVTTPAVTGVRERLERTGFEVLVFHATGAGAAPWRD